MGGRSTTIMRQWKECNRKRTTVKAKRRVLRIHQKRNFTRKMSTHPFREATPRQQAQSPLRICRTVNCIDGRVVVWRREDRGRSGKRKRSREATVTLHERRQCPRLDDSGHGAARWDTNGPRRGFENGHRPVLPSWWRARPVFWLGVPLARAA